MNMRFVTVLLLAAPLLANAAGMPKQVDVFEGLLPAGFVVKDGPPITANQLRNSTVALVASANFDNMTKLWVDYYEKGGKQKQAKNLAFLGVVLGAGGLASTAAGMQQGNALVKGHGDIVRDASDPRTVSDKLVAALTPYCGKLIVASDFAAAIEQNANYIVLIDFYGRFYPPGINTRYRADVSLQLFEPTLQRLMLAPGHAEIPRKSSMNFMSPGAVLKGTAATYARGMQISVDETLAVLHEKLGPSPAGLPNGRTSPAAP